MLISDMSIVRQLLKAYPDSRENEHRLYELYLSTKKIDIGKATVKALFAKVASGKLRSIRTITRYSQIAQKEDETLRGENYGQRMQKEKEVRAEMRERIPVDLVAVNGNIDERNRRHDPDPTLFT